MGTRTFRSANIGSSLVGSSFSGSDVLPIAYIENDDNGDPIIFADLQTITVTSAVSSTPVLRLGQRAPVSLSKTDRTTAGTMIFSHIDQSPLFELNAKKDLAEIGIGDIFRHPTDTPPFDILLSAKSEIGYNTKDGIIDQAQLMLILGVSLLNSSQTISVDDMLVEHQYTYWAKTSTDWFPSDTLSDVMNNIRRESVHLETFGDSETKNKGPLISNILGVSSIEYLPSKSIS